MKDSEIIQIGKEAVDTEGKAIIELKNQFNEQFIKAVRLLLDCKGHVLVAGAGTSHAIARRLAHLLSCCGTPALLIDVGDSQHGLSGAVRENDVLIALSKGGQTAEVIFLAQISKKHGASLIAITENPTSDLGKISDVVLKVVAPEGIDPFGMVATGSSLVNAAFGDALCVALLKLRGYSIEQFGMIHPGGAVGKKIEEMDIR